MTGLNFTFAPPSKLVKSFFVAGSLFYLLFTLLFFSIDLPSIDTLSPKALGAVHLLLVGFGMSIIFGAMYQLISVILEIPVYSHKLAYTHLILFIGGLTLFVLSFITVKGFEYIHYTGALLYLSFLLYIINILLSIREVNKREIKYYTVLVVHLLLLVGVSYGLLAIFAMIFPQLNLNALTLVHTHIPLVVLGFMGGLIGIIATVLLPMFMLSHNFNHKISHYLLGLLIVGSLLSFLSWNMAVIAVSILFVLLLAYELYEIFTKRLRKGIDVYALDMVGSILFLILSAPLLAFVANPYAQKLLLLILFIGFLNSFIVGHIYKIVPFLIWNEKFAPLVGKEKVPMLADMVHPKLSEVEFYVKIATVILLLFGFFLKSALLLVVGKVLLIVNALLLLANVGYIFYYKG